MFQIAYIVYYVAFGGIWDNMRLACGAYWGMRSLSDIVAHVSFFLHMAVLPSLLASYAQMLSMMTEVGWIQYPGKDHYRYLHCCGSWHLFTDHF